MRRLRAQSSVEMVFMVTILTAAIIPFAYYAISSSSQQKTYYDAKTSVQKIADAVEYVYSQSYPAKSSILVYMPDGIYSGNTFARNHTINIAVTTGGERTDYWASTNALICNDSSLPAVGGRYSLIVKFEASGCVNITK